LLSAASPAFPFAFFLLFFFFFFAAASNAESAEFLKKVALQLPCERWREWCLILPDLLIESEALAADMFSKS
jgi:hypothetical protein